MSNLPPEMQIGVASIDSEHFRLVSLLDRLIYDPSPTTARFSEAFRLLGEEIVAHFTNEERILRSCGMPMVEVDAHVEAHNRILDEYALLDVDMIDNSYGEAWDVSRMIRSWILDHLVEYDLKICKYITTK